MAHIQAPARVKVSTLDRQVKKIVEPGMRDHVQLAKLGSMGRIKYNVGSDIVKWRVRYLRNDPHTHGDMETITGSRVNRHKSMELPMRAYALGEVISKFERLAQQGEWKLFSLVDETIKGMGADFNEFFHLELYKDGNLSPARTLHGLESIFSYSGQFSAVNSGDGRLYKSNESYGGLDCTPGAYGGAWSGAYPDGTGDLRYHFLQPCIVDYTSTDGTPFDWPVSEKTWKYTWRHAMSLATSIQKTFHGKGPDMWLCTPTMEREVLESQYDKERIAVSQDAELLKLGFKHTTHLGVPILGEYGCTAGVAYGLKWSEMCLESMQSQIFSKDDDEDITTQTKLMTLDFFGNMRYTSPAFFCKLLAIGGS